MKTCEWLINGSEPCGKLCEGKNALCATHAREARKIVTDADKEAVKRDKALQKAKIKRSHPRPKPKQVSDKRKELNKEYSLLRLHYLANHMECEVKLLGCEATSIEIHHTYSGTNKVKHLNDVSTWKATCGHCHKILHDKLSAKEARELGLKITI